MANIQCQNCEDDDAEFICEACPSDFKYFCRDCADDHIEKKRYAVHKQKMKSLREGTSDIASFRNFLEDLGFLECYKTDQKLTANKALMLYKADYCVSHTFKPKELLMLILRKAMGCNYHCRSVLLHRETDRQPYPAVYHPMDTLLALILCCDPIFRQDLFTRLYTCQLALPMLIPIPDSDVILFPIWAMKGIVKQWKSLRFGGQTIKLSHEGRIVDFEMPIVSFMRFNQPKKLCKSKIINEVISKSKHKYFFDYECKGSDAERRFVNGLVEVSWYLPSGGENDFFPEPITFLNLRGNAQNHMKQFKVLSRISQAIFLFLKAEDIKGGEIFDFLSSNANRPGKLHIVMNTASIETMERIKKIPNCEFIIGKGFGPAAITEKFQYEINATLKKNLKTMKFSECHEHAGEFTIEIDENIPECLSGKQISDSIMTHVQRHSENQLHSAKKAIVPLQGPDYWHKWAELSKKQERMKLSAQMEEYSKIEEEKQKILENEILLDRSPAMKTFIENLLAPKSSKVRVYFLHWLKHHLDDHSRVILPELHAKCESTRKSLAKLEKEDKITEEARKDKKKNLEEILYKESVDFSNASFGLEHFFRELAQIYEVFSARKDNPAWQQVQHFPSIVAELLLCGFPLELIDGDAAHIAKNWIFAVLNELKKKIKGKIFVLSVLGIQSSGKSTLLNTAFGLRFAVSAGRCTRGAYFQLLKCDKESFQGKCEYLIVIDTEGLRAPELAFTNSQKHDNELAALIIGLAGVTIINVFGEVSGEIDDILQTTVHAFLRIKRTELKPSCLLVKHHVDKVSSNKGMEGLRNLQAKLDKMAEYAASEENCKGLYKKFSDIIKFDVVGDVRYFPNLWIGSPPMAPVDPEYSEEAQMLKFKFIMNIYASSVCHESSDNALCTLDEFILRIEALWNAVLKENFIFNFKNTLEIVAFNELDQKTGNWRWDLDSEYNKWELTAFNYAKSGMLENQQKKLEKDLEDQLKLKNEIIEKEIEELFEKHESMWPWKETTKKKIELRVNQLKLTGREFCDSKIKQKKGKEIVQNKKQFEDKLLSNVQILVSKMGITKSTKITASSENEKLRQTFFDTWDQWMQEIKEDCPPIDRTNIDEEMKIQLEYNCGIGRHVAKMKKSLEVRRLSLREDVDYLLCDMQDHRKKYYNEGWGLQKLIDRNRQRKYTQVENGVKEIWEAKKKELDKCIEKESYNVSHIIPGIVASIEKEISDLQESKKIENSFSFTDDLHVEVILSVCGYAFKVFHQVQEAKNAANPITHFSNQKSLYWDFFLTTSKSEIEGKAGGLAAAETAACALAKEIMKEMETPFTSKLQQSLVVMERGKVMFKSKKALKREVLLQLVKRKDFDSFRINFTSISRSYKSWVRKFVTSDCTKIENGSKPVVAAYAEKELQEFRAAISKAMPDIVLVSDFGAWLSKFHKLLAGLIPFLTKPFEIYKANQYFDLKHFEATFSDCIKSELNSFSSKFERPNRFVKAIDLVASELCGQLTGCCKQCPFCNEQCELTASDHPGKHSCTIHRPRCLAGMHYVDSKEMILTICNESVAGKRRFRCYETNNEFKPYSEYDKVFPDWYISSELDHIPTYWQWVVGTYSKQIADHFEIKESTADQLCQWKQLSPEAAKKDVEESYQQT